MMNSRPRRRISSTTNSGSRPRGSGVPVAAAWVSSGPSLSLGKSTARPLLDAGQRGGGGPGAGVVAADEEGSGAGVELEDQVQRALGDGEWRDGELERLRLRELRVEGAGGGAALLRAEHLVVEELGD